MELTSVKRLSRLTKRKIVAAIAAIVVVFLFYQYNEITVAEKIDPQKVLLTAVDIPPHTKITEDMLFERVVPSDAIPPNVYSSMEDVVGKWTVEGYGIVKNSYIYEGKILATDKMPDAAILELEPHEYAFPLLVDLETSSGNAIIPGAYVDLHFATGYTDDEKPLTGLIFESVRVTSVKDSKTQNVFSPSEFTEDVNETATTTNDERALAKLYTLAVSAQQLDYLNKAKLLGNIIPVAHGKSYQDELEDDELGELLEKYEHTSSDSILDWIDRNSHNIFYEIHDLDGDDDIDEDELMGQGTFKTDED